MPPLALAALAPVLALSQLLLIAGLYAAALIGLRLRRSAHLQDIWQRLCERSNARLVDLDAQLSVEGDLRGPWSAQILVTDSGLYLATLSRSPLGSLYRDVRVLQASAAVPEHLRCALLEPPRWEEDALLLHVRDASGPSTLRVLPSDPRALRSRLPRSLTA
ncbi:MAG: hypothetical protein H6741_25415 [Alphaproteobacteria bacterium]|nr:hypothetical protein [Alphaproteobacteria bacterium]